MSDDFEVREEREARHFWADNELFDHFCPLIGAYGFAVYMALCRYSNGCGECYPSMKTLCSKLGLSEGTVRKAIGALVEAGLIKVDHRYDSAGDLSTNVYRLRKIKGGTSRGEVPHDGEGVPHVVNHGTSPREVQVPHHVRGGTSPREVKQEPLNKTTLTKTTQQHSVNDGGGGDDGVVLKKLVVVFGARNGPKVAKANPDLLASDVEQVATWIASKPDGISNPTGYAFNCLMQGRLPMPLDELAPDKDDDPAVPEDDPDGGQYDESEYDEAEQYARPATSAPDFEPVGEILHSFASRLLAMRNAQLRAEGKPEVHHDPDKAAAPGSYWR